MKHFVFLIIILLGTVHINAQLGVGQWRMHVSPYSAHDLVYANGDIYVLLKKGVLEYDVESGEKTLWTAADYLSDVSPSAIAYHKDLKAILIGYTNGNLDLIINNRVFNMPFILQSNATGRKEINKIVIHGDLAYLATGVGIVVIDIKKKEVKDTYHSASGTSEYLDLAFLNDKIYSVTEEGVYEGSSNNPFLADPGQWTRLDDIIDYTTYGRYSEIERFGEELLLIFNNQTFGNSDTLYHIVNGTPVVLDSAKQFYGLNGEGESLLVSTYDALHIFDGNLQHMDLIYQYENGISPHPRTAAYIAGHYFIADRDYGLVKAVNSYARTHILFDGPRYNSGYRAEWAEGKLSIACGGYSGTGPSYNQDGGAIFEEEKWKSIAVLDQVALKDQGVWDFVCTSINPVDVEKVAYGTLSNIPIVITKNGNVTDTFSIHNSLLEEAGSTGWAYITDVSYDDNGNLWVANSISNKPIKVLTKGGQWYDFDLGGAVKEKVTKRMLIDNNGVKWLGFRDAGLVAFDHGNKIEDASDDRYKIFNTGANSGDLPSNEVEAIAADFDNNIWIGTPEGMRVLYNTSNVFDASPGQYNFQKLLIEFGEYVEIVLGTTHITSIVIDGANRKWVGTASSGVFLLSPDGLEVIKTFTTENSSLLSNTIYDIAINHSNGEIFFLTEEGIVSYRSDASQGDIEYSEVKVFPNPVYPDIEGPITIQGIAYDSDVRITDVSGKLIYQTKSNGGTATWNGKTMDGERAATGVYLIWTSIDDHEFKGRKVGKVLLIN